MPLRNNRRLMSFLVLLIAAAAVIFQWVWPGPQSKSVTYLTLLLAVALVFVVGFGFRSNAYKLKRPWTISAERSRGSLWSIVKGLLCWGGSILLAACAALAVRFGIIPDSAAAVLPAMAPTLVLIVVGTYFLGVGVFKWLFGTES